MAQHIPIEAFKQKQMKAIAESIRKQTNFRGSLKYQRMDDMYMENDFDEVYGADRRTPKSITGHDHNFFEIHTRPSGEDKHKRIATNIYLVA